MSETPSLRTRLAAEVLLVLAALALVAIGVGRGVGGLSIDLVREYVPAARAVLHGASPYGAGVTPLPYLYPPLLALLAVPLVGLPGGVLALLGAFASIALVLGTLGLVGVRDWRCYAVSLAWAPVGWAVQSANVSILLVFLVALGWRFRSRTIGREGCSRAFSSSLLTSQNFLIAATSLTMIAKGFSSRPFRSRRRFTASEFVASTAR